MAENTKKRVLIGDVVSDKMTKTVGVVISRAKRHPPYGKGVRTTKRLKAHDELKCQVGDVVQIVESQPISKEKRWVVEKVVNANTGVELVEA